MSAPLPVTYESVLEARTRIEGAINKTPCLWSQTLSAITGANVFLKFEIFQYTAAYKERGALNKLLSLDAAQRARGVIAASAGNHAQGVAWHASRLGIPATIVMPNGTPFTKVKRTEELGARVVLAGSTFAEASAACQKMVDDEGYTFVHPFDDPLIMAGQGTVGLEMLEQVPDLDVLVVPIGGGGLISGIAVAAKAIKPTIRVYGVQSENYPSMREALQGRTIEATAPTVAEGIAVKTPGKLTRRVVQALVDDIIVVPEAKIEHAINLLLEVEKVVVEGAGATGLAALLERPAFFTDEKVGVVLTGGNIDPRTLASVITRGLARDGRISRLHIQMADIPGGLAKVATIIAEGGANIVEVIHDREFAAMSVKYTELRVVIETKDAPHARSIIHHLETAGFPVKQHLPS